MTLSDTATLSPTATPNSVFVSGVKLAGLLQLDTPHSDRKQSEAAVVAAAGPTASELSRHDRASVVLQVTSSCVAGHGGVTDATDGHQAARHTFRCPIYREGGWPSRPQRAEASIAVRTATPLAQLALSGSGLRVASLQ